MRARSWRLTLRVIAVLSWVVSLLWLIVDPGYEPLLAFLGGAGLFLGSFAGSDTPIGDALKDSQASTLQERYRRALLGLVRNTWIKGVLEQSLHGAAMIALGMEERADAVERPCLISRVIMYQVCSPKLHQV